MVSSVPETKDVEVALNSSIVLTFNNVILNQGITLFTDTFTPVNTTLTKSADGKIITIKPDADLSATTGYVLMISNVTDVHGQTLENQVINLPSNSIGRNLPFILYRRQAKYSVFIRLRMMKEK